MDGNEQNMEKKDSSKGGLEGFYLDKDGKKQDREFWDAMLGDDVMPDHLRAPNDPNYRPESKPSKTPSKISE